MGEQGHRRFYADSAPDLPARATLAPVGSALNRDGSDQDRHEYSRDTPEPCDGGGMLG